MSVGNEGVGNEGNKVRHKARTSTPDKLHGGDAARGGVTSELQDESLVGRRGGGVTAGNGSWFGTRAVSGEKTG
jgi:hypothetical protein